MKSVRSKAKPDKRDAILSAMLDLVVERGFHNACPSPKFKMRLK